MKSIGAEAVGSTPQQLADLLAYETRLWGDVIKSANLTIQ
jgi:hypothetical protein